MHLKGIFGVLAMAFGVACCTANPGIIEATLHSPDGKFDDHVTGFSYNRADLGNRTDASLPTAQMGFESYWEGSQEWNIDLLAPNESLPRRPLAFTGAYDGSRADLLIGGDPYGKEATGVEIQGGTSLEGQPYALQCNRVHWGDRSFLCDASNQGSAVTVHLGAGAASALRVIGPDGKLRFAIDENGDVFIAGKLTVEGRISHQSAK